LRHYLFVHTIQFSHPKINNEFTKSSFLSIFQSEYSFLQLLDPLVLLDRQRNLGAGSMQEKRYAEAVEHLRRATEIEPEDQGSWFGYGQALEASGRIKPIKRRFPWMNTARSANAHARRARRLRRKPFVLAEPAR
jgi:tetratricopeptide (TPR) repeat protein